MWDKNHTEISVVRKGGVSSISTSTTRPSRIRPCMASRLSASPPVGRGFVAPLRRRPSSGSLTASTDQATDRPVAMSDPKVPASAPDYSSPVLLVGLGDPVSDILVRLDDPSLAARVFDACGISEPGGCVPVDSDDDIRSLLSACGEQWIAGAGSFDQASESFSEHLPDGNPMEPSYCPGGSAANVAKGVANLGGDAAFVGMIGRDDIGARYRDLLRSQKVRPILLEVDESTENETAPPPRSAQCLSLVEKGGQRTMRTYLGASLKMGASHFDEHVERLAFEGGRGGDDANAKSSITPSSSTLLHVEGYTLYRPELARTAMAAAKRRGALVSLDLASFEVVRNCRAQLTSLLEDGLVDLLFCNEDEAAELLGETRSPDAFAREDAGRAMEWMLRYVQVATVSLGARGCVTRDRRGDRGVSPGARVSVVDTTGAGDSFTAAFLWAYLRKGSLQACCACGCAVGTAVVQVLGAELTGGRWGELRDDLETVLERDRSRALDPNYHPQTQ